MRVSLAALILFLAVCTLMSCNKRPKGVLSDAEMVQLITDMEVAEVYIQDNSQFMYNDSMRDKTVEWILKKRGIDKAQFDSTMTWYGRNIDVYRDLYTKVDAELAKRQKKATGEDNNNTSVTGMDLWPYSRHILLSDIANTQSMTFAIPPEKIEKGDRLHFNMRTRGLSTGGAMLGVDYEDGGSAYSYSNQNGNSKIELTLQLDTSRVAKRIFGYLRSSEKNNTPVWIDSITLQRLPFDSTQYYKIFSQRKYSGPKKRTVVKPDSIVKDEQDADLQKILTEDGGLAEEDKPMDKPPRTLKRANSRILDKSPQLNEKPLKVVNSK